MTDIPYLHGNDPRLDALFNALKAEIYARCEDVMPLAGVIGVLELLKLDIYSKNKD